MRAWDGADQAHCALVSACARRQKRAGDPGKRAGLVRARPYRVSRARLKPEARQARQASKRVGALLQHPSGAPCAQDRCASDNRCGAACGRGVWERARGECGRTRAGGSAAPAFSRRIVALPAFRVARRVMGVQAHTHWPLQFRYGAVRAARAREGVGRGQYGSGTGHAHTLPRPHTWPALSPAAPG